MSEETKEILEQANIETTSTPETGGDATSQAAGDVESQFSDELAKQAAGYGIDPNAYGSEEAVRAVMADRDRQVAEQWQQQQQQQQAEYQRQQQEQWQQQQKQVIEQTWGPEPEEPDWENLDADEATKGLLKQQHEQLKIQRQQNIQMQQYQAQIQQQQMAAQANDMTARFERELDQISPEFYGVGQNVTAEQQARRQAALQGAMPFVYYQMQNDPNHTGWDWSSLVRRAANATHSNDLFSQQQQQRAEQIRDRSAQRMGGHPRTVGDTGPAEVTSDPTQDPELMAKAYEIFNRGS